MPATHAESSLPPLGFPPGGLAAPLPPTGIDAPRNVPLEGDWRTPPAELAALDVGALPSFDLAGKSSPPPRLPSVPAPAAPAPDLGGFDFELAVGQPAETHARPPSAPPPPMHAPDESFALDEQPRQRAPSAREPSDPGEVDAALSVGLDAPPASPAPAPYPHAFQPGEGSGPPGQSYPGAPHPGALAPGQQFVPVDMPPAGPSQATLAAQAVLKSLPSGDEVKRFARHIAVASIGGKQQRVIKLEDPSTWLRPMAGPLVAFGLAVTVAVVSVALTRGSDSDVNLSWLYVPLLLGSIIFGVIRWIRLQD